MIPSFLCEKERKAGASVRIDVSEVNATAGRYDERAESGEPRSAGDFGLNGIQELLHLEGFLECTACAQHAGHIQEV